MMMLIQVDNFDREGPGHDDKLLLYINNEEKAHEIARLINEDCDDPNCNVFFKAVPNNYKLKRFEI